MNLLEINPYIRRAIHSTLPAKATINRRIILDYELLYIESGELLLTYNETDYLCKPGNFLLLCPNVSHSFKVLDSALSQPHIHFDLKYDHLSEQVFICYQDYPQLTQAEQALIRRNPFSDLARCPLLHLRNKEAFTALFFQIIDAPNSNSLHCKSLMLSLLELLIADHPPEHTNTAPPHRKIPQQIRSYIDSNCDQKLTLSALERQFDYSRFYIEKLFRQEYGVSVISYYNQKRMEQAVLLLQDHSVSETAELLSFSSIYAFSRAFSTVFGTSPSKFRAPAIPGTQKQKRS